MSDLGRTYTLAEIAEYLMYPTAQYGTISQAENSKL
jgi:hypothetical protein